MTETEIQSCRRSIEFHAARTHRKAGRQGVERNDLVQEGYVALFMAAGRYVDKGASLATFADRAVEGAMLRFVQRGRGRGITGFGYQNGYEPLRFVSLHVVPNDGTYRERPDLPPSSEADPHATAEASQVRDFVRELPERERTVVMLFYWHDLDQPEIARRLGLSQPGVSRIMRRARERLRERLGAYGG